MLKQGKCKHFTGIRDAQCAAGVNYVLVSNDFKLSLPCLPAGKSDKREPAECELFCEPTTAEIAEDRAKFDAHMDKMRVVMTGIAAYSDGYTVGKAFQKLAQRQASLIYGYEPTIIRCAKTERKDECSSA